MGLWAVLCLAFFLITFASARERIAPEPQQRSSPKQDFADLFGNRVVRNRLRLRANPLVAPSRGLNRERV